jgi:uncharacterized protein YicC (UPF0701 family)
MPAIGGAIVLMKCRPMIEEFRQAINEKRKRGAFDARIEMMLDYIETKNASVDPEVLEVVMSELRAAARATHQGSRKVQ